jgi:polar amino acid transport system permease protein
MDMPVSGRRAAREAARRARARRSTTIAAVATIVVLGTAAIVILTSPGWPAVRDSFFSASAFKASFPSVLKGFWLDVQMFVVVEVIVLVLGLLIAVCRVSQVPWLFPLRLVATVYTDVFRGVPTILLVYLVGFGVPALQGADANSSFILGLSLPTNPVVLGCAALSLSYSAYVAEVYRAGIDSVHAGQTSAALALGLTRGQAMRFVILPQAVRRVLPPLLNDFISLQKDVALVSILGVVEAFQAAQIYAQAHFNYTPLIAAAMLYLAVTIPLSRTLDRMQARARHRREAAGV